MAANEQIRFLVVGAWNTLFGYLMFLLCHTLVSQELGPFGILILSYCLAIPQSYMTQRILVFRSKGPWLHEFWRFILANSVIFSLNLVLLPLLVASGDLDARLVQAALIVLLTIASYLAHRYFSFPRPR